MLLGTNRMLGVMLLLQDNLIDFSMPQRRIQALGLRRLTRVLLGTEELMETLWYMTFMTLKVQTLTVCIRLSLERKS